MYKLPTPNQSGYSFTETNGAVWETTKGGFARARDDLDGCTILINCTWFLSKDDWTLMQLIWRQGVARGGATALMDVLIDSAGLETQTVSFRTAPAITGAVGTHYQVSATMEVTPYGANDAFYTSVTAVYVASSGDPDGYLNLFAPIIANWPSA